jgi:tetratricopeptide (TPR) repeat protein
MAYGRRGDYDRAIADFNAALSINPKSDVSLNNRGYTFMMKKDFDRAVSDFDQSIAVNPKSVLAYLNRGNTYAIKRDKNRACADWTRACELGSCKNITTAKEKGFCRQ